MKEATSPCTREPGAPHVHCHLARLGLAVNAARSARAFSGPSTLRAPRRDLGCRVQTPPCRKNALTSHRKATI
jgi:hypothetical protein